MIQLVCCLTTLVDDCRQDKDHKRDKERELMHINGSTAMSKTIMNAKDLIYVWTSVDLAMGGKRKVLREYLHTIKGT